MIKILGVREAMSKRKTPKSRFVLEEENGLVIASVVDENDLSLQHTIHGLPHPRVRAPRLTKTQIEQDFRRMAAIFHQSQEEFLISNIDGINREINEHVHEIRRLLSVCKALLTM